MALRWIIIGLAAAVVLGFTWYRNRRSIARVELESGRGNMDETTAAFEDIAPQIIQDSNRNYLPGRRSRPIDPVPRHSNDA